VEAQPFLPPLLDWLIVLLSVGLPGLPPGANDPQLLRIIPPDAVVALEWSGRGNAPAATAGIDALQRDPEIRRAVEALQQIRTSLHPSTSPIEDPSLSTIRDRWPAIAELLWQQPGCFYVAWKPDLGGKWIPRAAIVVRAGDHPEAAFRAWQTVLPAWMLADEKAAPQLIPNALWHFRRVGPYFVWSLGTEVLDTVAAKLQAPLNQPPGNPALMAAVKAWDAPRPGHRLWINLPIDDWRQRHPELWERAPLSAVADYLPAWQALSILGSDERGLVSRTVWLDRPHRPQAQSFTPMTPTARQLIPADAHLAASVGLSLPEVGGWLKQIVAHVPTLPPDALQQWRERFEAEMGMNLQEDVLPAFGSTWTIYSAPSTGGAFGLSPVFSLDVRKPREAHAVFTQAMHVLHRHIPHDPQQGVTFHDELFLDRAIYTIQLRSGGGPSISIALSFCITDRQLLVTLQPQTMRSHLRFLEAGGPTIAARPEAAVRADALGFVFVDAPAFMQTLWPLLPLVANGPLNNLPLEGLGFDGSVVPSTGAILPHIRPALGVLRRSEHALVAELRNPLSAAAPLLTAAGLWGLSQGVRTTTTPLSAPSPGDVPTIDLGAPEGEVTEQAPISALDVAAVAPPYPPIPVRPAVPDARRVWLSGLLRAVTPDDVEATIPPTVFDRLERGPSPEELQRREERRKTRQLQRSGVPVP
jgi:hypothetical protein